MATVQVNKQIDPAILGVELDKNGIKPDRLQISFNQSTVFVDFLGDYTANEVQIVTTTINNHPNIEVIKENLGNQNLIECAQRQNQETWQPNSREEENFVLGVNRQVFLPAKKHFHKPLPAKIIFCV